jgi:hypothetical protein
MVVGFCTVHQMLLSAFSTVAAAAGLTWLQAMEEDDDHASQFLVEALSMLKQLPVNKAFVQSTKSAKVVGALRKHDSTDVRKLAREVVGLWMQVVSSSSGSSTAKSSR